MTLKGALRSLMGRKSTVKRRKAVYISAGLHTMLKVYAREKALYLEEVAEGFLRQGLLRAQGWKEIEDTKATSAVQADGEMTYTADEIATMRLCEQVLDAGCPPEEISILASLHPNLREWAEEQGIGYAEKQRVPVSFPPEYSPE